MDERFAYADESLSVGTTTKPTGNSLCLLVDRPAIAQPNVDDQHKLCFWTRKQNL